MQENRLDLNLIRMFIALFETGSVTLAAERFHITQPAMSNGLSRLRLLLDDPLFVQTRQGMTPTAYASKIYPDLSQAMHLVLSTLGRNTARPAFTPEASTFSLKLHMTDFAQVAFLPRLISEMQHHAPHCSLKVVSLSNESILGALENNELDFVFGRMPEKMPHKIDHVTLFREQYVVLMRKEHPLSKRQLTKADYLGAGHALVSAGSHQAIERLLKRKKASVLLTTQNFLVVAQILQASDLIATVPSRLAVQLCLSGSFVQTAIPFDLPHFDVNMMWDKTRANEPEQAWARGLFETILAE
ncbi:LysR family transcriptional regulator [Leeia oryzae]|uniref:LysR family transcriptional regulator n=1 Tax=Leeia oryzae TaxID=356662 RepID=UPI0003719671|nr:LysR family transcriptional regulator [Leeia oryzae]